MLNIVDMALCFILVGIAWLVFIVLMYAFIHAFYMLAGFWGALGAFLFCAAACCAAEKKLKEEREVIEYYREHGITPPQAEGFNATDFVLGWVFSRLFK
jgi:hypothetical protein